MIACHRGLAAVVLAGSAGAPAARAAGEEPAQALRHGRAAAARRRGAAGFAADNRQHRRLGSRARGRVWLRRSRGTIGRRPECTILYSTLLYSTMLYYAMLYTLYAIRYTLYAIRYTLHAIRYILCTMYYVLCTVRTIKYVRYTIHASKSNDAASLVGLQVGWHR